MSSHYEQFIVSLVAFAAVFIGTNERPPQARCYVKHLDERPFLRHLFGACGRAHYDLAAFTINALLAWILIIYIGTLSTQTPDGSFVFFYLLLVKYLATRVFHLSHYQKTKRQVPLVACALLLYALLLPLIGWVLFSLLLFGGSFSAVMASLVLVPVGVWYAAHALWASLLLDHLRRLPPDEEEVLPELSVKPIVVESPPPPPPPLIESNGTTTIKIEEDFDLL